MNARLAAPLFLLVAAGCVSYQPDPLEPEREWKRIEELRLESLAPPAREVKGAEKGDLPPFDYSNGLSSDEAAGLAVVLNPELRAFRLERGIAEAQLTGAGLLPNPEIDTKWLVPTNAPAWKGEVNALFDLTRALLRRGLEKERARIRIEEIRWETADKEWRTAAEARLAHVDLVYQDEALKLFEEQRRVRQRILEGIRARQRAGAASQLDTLVAEAELADLERQGKRLAGERRKALQRLNRILGLPPNHDTRLETPERPLAYSAPPPRREALLQRLRDRRPDLLAAAQAYEGAEKELQLACRKQFPALRLGPSYERDGGSDLLGFGAALELPLFDRNQGEIALKLAEREQKRRLYAAQLVTARADLEAAWASLESLDAELKYYFDEVAPRLEKSLELTEQALKLGDVGLQEVLLVEKRLLETRSEALKSLRDFHQAKVQVDRASGPEPGPAPAPAPNP